MPCETAVVTSRSFGSGDADPAATLRAAGLTVLSADNGHEPARLAEPLASAVGWIAGSGGITAELLDAAPQLRVIARVGTGTDAIDMAATAARGIVVTNTPGANTEAVADHTVGLMLAALRGTADGDRVARSGSWTAPRRGRELGSLTVGIVGYGMIGRAVARRLRRGFGCTVLAHDPFAAGGDDGNAQLVDFDVLVGRADVLSLHLPATSAPLVDGALLARCRPGLVLVNTARGALLDEAVVADALRSGWLGAVAVDVLSSEPPTSSPLLGAPNVTVTPHVGATTTEAIDRMGVEAAAEVVRVLSGEPPLHPVAPHDEVASR